MEAGKRTISDLFTKGRSLDIPFFQRGYVWEEDNWERLLDDMLSVASGRFPYFLGSIILKQNGTGSDNEVGDRRIVVDGQQRLTTVLLFFKTLCDIKGEQDSFKAQFYNLKNEIILKHNRRDIRIFNAIISGKLSEPLEKAYEGNRVLECYRYFQRNGDAIVKLDMYKLISRVYFVGIDLGVEEDEQQIFDTINSLGVSLTTAELLKNELYRREDMEVYEQTWGSAFEKDEDTKQYWDMEITSGRARRANIDLLLQAFLLIRTKANERYIRIIDLFKSYKTHLQEDGVDKAEFVTALTEYATEYRDSIDPDLLHQDIDAESRIERLNVVFLGLNMTTAFPYFLYVIYTVRDHKERQRMLGLLESYIIRRVICRGTAKNYNNIFASFIRNEVDTYAKLAERLVEADDQTNKMPTDDDLARGFEDNNLTNQQARVVLYMLEKSVRDEELHGTSPVAFSRYSLEHVMPKKWRNNWGRLPDNEADERDRLVLKMGNLTLITSKLNSVIRDATWDIKKRGSGRMEGLNKYATGLDIFNDYLSRESWNEDTIRDRNVELLEHAKSVWPYPGYS